MYLETKKIHLIEELLKIKNEIVLTEIETVLNNYKQKVKKQNSIQDFVGIISKKDANEMSKAIADSCQNIDDNEYWK